MTLIIVIVTGKSMLERADPKISSFARPLIPEEMTAAKGVNLGEAGFIVGTVATINGLPAQIPPEVGKLRGFSMATESTDIEYYYHEKDLRLVDCAKVIPAYLIEN